jgi:hypothetical protein
MSAPLTESAVRRPPAFFCSAPLPTVLLPQVTPVLTVPVLGRVVTARQLGHKHMRAGQYAADRARSEAATADAQAQQSLLESVYANAGADARRAMLADMKTAQAESARCAAAEKSAAYAQADRRRAHRGGWWWC